MKTVTGANDGSMASGAAPTAVEAVAPAEPGSPPPPDPDPEPAAPPDSDSAAPPAGEAEDQTLFWMPWHPRWPIFPARTPRHPPPRRPAFGVFALVVLGLVAAFIAWVSAEPLWLAVGHGDRGIASATHCSIEGSPYECVVFTAAGGRYAAEDVTLLGTEHGHLRQGSRVAAEMVSPSSSRAYAVDDTGLRLRSAAGLVALLLCGLGIAWAPRSCSSSASSPPPTRPLCVDPAVDGRSRIHIVGFRVIAKDWWGQG
jgi:hypothetical protein